MAEPLERLASRVDRIRSLRSDTSRAEQSKLQEIEARANAATPWTADECDLRVYPEDSSVYAPQGATLGKTLITLGDTYEGSDADWLFVAHARTDVSDLVAEVRRLTAALATARREGAEEMRERAACAVEPAGWDGDEFDGYDRWDTADALAMRVRRLPLDAPGGAT